MTPAHTRPPNANTNGWVSTFLLLLTILSCNQITSASDSDLRIEADTGGVLTMAGEDNTLWIGTTNGLYRWDDVSSGVPGLVAPQTGTVSVLRLVGDTLWIGSERGLFRWDEPRHGSPQRVDAVIGSVNKLHACGPTLLIAAKGLFIWPNVKAGSPVQLSMDVYPVTVFHWTGAILWIGSKQGLLRWDCESNNPPVFISKVKEHVTSISSYGTSLVIGTSRALFRWDWEAGSDPKQVLADSEIFSIVNDGSAFLISVKGKGLFRWENIDRESPQLVDSNIVFSSRYCRTGSILWMGAGTGEEAGLFRWDSLKEVGPQRLGSLNLGFIQTISKSDTTLWIGSVKGLYRIEGLNSNWDAKITITSELPKIIYSDHNLLIQWNVGHWGGRTTPALLQYQVVVKDAEGREVPLEGSVVTGRQELTLPSLATGDYSLYVQAADLNGRLAVSRTIKFTVLSSSQHWRDGLIIGVIGYVILILLVVILAPFNDFCHYLLMNPWVRRIGSFLIIPIVITVFPFVRRHILKRYLRAIKKENEFSDWQTKLLLPTEDLAPETFGARLSKVRKLLLLGQAGIGKTVYFKYLTGYYARDSRVAPRGAIPVFFPLSRYQGKLPENIFNAQLAAHGQLIDEELNNWFMQKGGFLIFIDGLNEIDESSRNKISAFVDQYSKTNYFCINSQTSYPAFANIEQIKLDSLTEDKIIEFLQQRLGDVQSQAIVKEFGGNISDVYKTPHDLEFVIDSKERKPEIPIPHSKIELYESTLSPILSCWLEEGRTDYPDLLFHRAYIMLCSRDPYFEDSDVNLPDDLRDRLVENRYLLPRSGHYLFRHDLIRSFLASKYFSRQWRAIVTEESLVIDESWRTMLEFVFSSLKQPEEARDLMDKILVKNSRLAGELFSWVHLTVPKLAEGWATDFKIKYANATLIIV